MNKASSKQSTADSGFRNGTVGGEGVGMSIEDFDLPELQDIDESEAQARIARYRARQAEAAA